MPVRVTIGRIDVDAPTPQRRRSPSRPAPSQSLDAYLRRVRGEST